MRIGKSASQSPTLADRPQDSWQDLDAQGITIKQPQLESRSSRLSSPDGRNALGNFKLANLEDSSALDSESVIIRASDISESSDSSESDVISAQGKGVSNDCAQIDKIYFSKPNIRIRCAAVSIFTASTAALGMLYAFTAKREDSIAVKAEWVAAAALSGLVISTAAGLCHFVCSTRTQRPDVRAQPA